MITHNLSLLVVVVVVVETTIVLLKTWVFRYFHRNFGEKFAAAIHNPANKTKQWANGSYECT